MPRPTKQRNVKEPPKIRGVKPIGVPARLLERVVLTIDEYEALRLADYEGFDHQKSADLMKISRPTFTRLITRARQKTAQVIVGVKELAIEGGQFAFQNDLLRCFDCGEIISVRPAEELPVNCSRCDSPNIAYLNQWFGRGRGHHRMRGPGRHRGRGKRL